MTAVEGNASVYQVLYMGRITGEERTDFVRAWGLSLNKRERGGGGERVNSICARKLQIL